MKRLKLTTSEGIEFISPFVYSDHMAEAKLYSMYWLVSKGAYMEIIEAPAGSYSKLEIFTREHETLTGDQLGRRIRKIGMATKGRSDPLNGTDEEEATWLRR